MELKRAKCGVAGSLDFVSSVKQLFLHVNGCKDISTIIDSGENTVRSSNQRCFEKLLFSLESICGGILF